MTSVLARDGLIAEATRARAFSEVGAFLEAALARVEGEGVVRIISMPAPLSSVERFLELPADTAVLFVPPRGTAFAGIGAARCIEVTGPSRIGELRDRAAELFEALSFETWPGTSPPPPRLLGGLAFREGGAGEAPWQGFGDGAFVLPRWTYARDGNGAWLSLAVTGPRVDSDERARALVELERIMALLLGPTAPGSSMRTALSIEHDPLEQWVGGVEAACRAIATGELQKVVMARSARVDLGAPIEAAGVLERFAEKYPGCTRFALRRGGATFLGATPELLVEKRGLEVRSEAMAGSASRGSADALLASEKDRSEHRHVVETVLARLAPFCRSIERSPEPRIRELPNVLHLDTPVRGELRGPTHILDLVEALHPTPAVGGVPCEPALRWISRHERTPRGWYSGPFGWFDAASDGELVVALRSGLVRDRHAWVYAGAGLVHGSLAEPEYGETALKMRALLDALGVEAPA